MEFTSTSEEYSVSELIFPNQGSSDVTSQNKAESYKWQIPNGWTLNGQVSNGTPFENKDTLITVVPDATSSGSIKVWALNGCNDSYSDPSEITVTRDFPTSMVISYTTENTFLQGDETEIDFSVPDWSYTKYEWIVPHYWSIIGSATNSTATLIPYTCGSSTVECEVTIPATGQTKTLSKYFPKFAVYPEDEEPYVTGTYLLCTSNHSR